MSEAHSAPRLPYYLREQAVATIDRFVADVGRPPTAEELARRAAISRRVADEVLAVWRARRAVDR